MTGICNSAIKPVGRKRCAGVNVRREEVLRTKHDPVKAPVIARAGQRQAASLRAAKAWQYAAHAEAAVVAEPFTIQAPLATASHVPVQITVEPIPIGLSGIATTSNHGVVLGAEVALQHAHH